MEGDVGRKEAAQRWLQLVAQEDYLAAGRLAGVEYPHFFRYARGYEEIKAWAACSESS